MRFAFAPADRDAAPGGLAARLGDYGDGAGELPNNRWLAAFQTAFQSAESAEQLITFDNIALALATYGVVELPSKLVESLIALSRVPTSPDWRELIQARPGARWPTPRPAGRPRTPLRLPDLSATGPAAPARRTAAAARPETGSRAENYR